MGSLTCPVCRTRLEDRGDSFYCPLCNVAFKKELDRAVTVFGISRAEPQGNFVSVRMGNTYIVYPTRSDSIVVAKTFKYFKELLKKLSDAGVDYVCVDARGNTLLATPTKKVLKGVEIGFVAERRYAIRGYYVMGSRSSVRVCRRAPVKRYREFYMLLLYLLSSKKPL